MAAIDNTSKTSASNSPHLSSDNQTVTAVAGAATLDGQLGVVTSESLTTAAAADYTLTITNARVKAGSVVLASVKTGTNTKVGLAIHEVTPANGSVATGT